MSWILCDTMFATMCLCPPAVRQELSVMAWRCDSVGFSEPGGEGADQVSHVHCSQEDRFRGI